MMTQNDLGYSNVVAVRVDMSNVVATLEQMKRIWTETGTQLPFTTSFLSDDISRLYEQEKRAGKALGIFAAMGILITCMSPFSLNALTTRQRAKEIAIRRVLGAHVSTVIMGMCRDVVYMMLAGLLTSGPLAYLMARKFLEEFAYGVGIGTWIYYGAGICVVLIAAGQSPIKRLV